MFTLLLFLASLFFCVLGFIFGAVGMYLALKINGFLR